MSNDGHFQRSLSQENMLLSWAFLLRIQTNDGANEPGKSWRHDYKYINPKHNVELQTCVCVSFILF